ncbi:MAG: hypothetical protein WA294_10370 [Acidobacteriaceae bacterium]
MKFQTFQQQIADRFTEERLIARLTQLFGALALLLIAIATLVLAAAVAGIIPAQRAASIDPAEVLRVE